MKKRKLKGYVLPAFYVLILAVMTFGISLLSKNLLDKKVENDEHYNYTMSVFDETENKEGENQEAPVITVKKPFTSEKVTIAKEFYNKDDTEENQTKALIFYENTYMPNTGILYESDEEFDCVSILDGKVKSIEKNEILGNVISIENTNKITSVYYTHGEPKVNVGDTIKMGDIVAKSGQSKLQTEKNQTLLFEIYMDNILVNPNTVYDKNITEINESH